MNRRNICIFASEVAALIGEHRFKDAEEAFQICLKRNFPTVVVENERGEIKVRAEIESNEAVQKVLNKYQLEPAKAIKAVEKVINTSDPLVAREIASQINTKNGKAREEIVLDTIEAKQNTRIEKRNAKLFKKYLAPDVVLVGRVDGWDSERRRVVELKCRQNRLFGAVPLYEKVQLMVYMFLTDTREITHIESFQGDENVVDIDWNQERWEEIEEKLQRGTIDKMRKNSFVNN